MRVFCPSYRRAGRVLARRLFPDAILAVHKEEREEYEEKEGGDLLVLSDRSKGNMAKVRNEILGEGGSEPFVMVDDDVREIVRTVYPGEGKRPVQQPLKGERLTSLLLDGFAVAQQLGVFLWGINVQSDPRFYRARTPLSFLSPVLGPFSCIVPSGIRYDERLGLNEDYDFWLQHVHRDHKTLRFNAYAYRAGHLTDSGGCAVYRLTKEEQKQADLMVKKWGGEVVKYRMKSGFNPTVNVPIRGV